MKNIYRRLVLGLLGWGVLLNTVLAVAACSSGGSAGGPLPGSTAGGKPVGLFFFMDVFNNQHVYYFTPAGQVYVDPADCSAAGLAAVDAHRRGTFAVGGGHMSVKWADGQTKTGNYHSDPTGFGWEGSFVCVAPFASAQQLRGTFDGRNAAVAVDANSATLFRTLTFNPNGTFTRDNYAAAHVETNTGAATEASSASQQAGRWSLSGWYLTLTDARGTVRGLAFPTSTSDDTKSGKVLYFRFNGTSYKNAN